MISNVSSKPSLLKCGHYLHGLFVRLPEEHHHMHYNVEQILDSFTTHRSKLLVQCARNTACPSYSTKNEDNDREEESICTTSLYVCVRVHFELVIICIYYPP